MAAQLVEFFIAGNLNSEEILKFVSSNDCSAICDQLQIPSVNSTEFIYELLMYLREQCSNVFEHAPRSYTVLSPRKNRRLTSSKPNSDRPSDKGTPERINCSNSDCPRQLCNPLEIRNSSQYDGSRNSTYRDQTDFSASSLAAHCGSPAALSFSTEEFPSLSDSSTPIKGGGKTPKREKLLHSTPIRSPGNLDVDTSPLASEGIFSRSLPKSSRADRAKQTSLTPQTAQSHVKDATHEQSVSPKKRITPTPVSVWQKPPVLIADFVNTPEMSRSPQEATQRQKKIARTMKQDNASIVPTSSDEMIDSPEMELVCRQETLDRLAHLYANCLTRNFVPNLLVEIHFVLQLLVVKIKRMNSQSSLLLGTISNCGYFAVQVLRYSDSLLAILGRDMLKLLRDLPHVQRMNLELHNRLAELYSQERSFSTFRSSFIQGVSFDTSIDNADNFPTQQQFGAFRRQRDAFCQLLKDWQEATFGYDNHELRFGSRVRNIFELCMDSCNLLHLAQLLTRHLVATCCGSLETDESGTTSEKVIQDLRNLNPDKLSKLRGRLKKPVSTSLSTRYQFNGHQAFFHSFILEANYAQFYVHLKSVLVNHIFNEDRQDMTPGDTETSIDSQVREELCTHLYRLRLYGAFLGLVEFLPYSTGEFAIPQLEEHQRTLREKMPPLVDLAECLRSSVREKRLLLTMSWASAYLALADPGISKLSTYQETWKILSALFRSCKSSDLCSVLFRMMIGWVYHNLDMPIIFSGPTIDISLKPGVEELIDVHLLQMTFPFLNNLKSIVIDYYCLNPNEVRLKKIAPVPVGCESRHELNLEAKLEETFFFIHPPSVKRNVAHVAKEIPENVVKSKKLELELQFREDVKASLKQVRASGKTVISEMMRTLAQNMCARLQLKAENILLPACDLHMGRALSELLSVDCSPDAVLVAKKICAKQCHMQIQNWIRSRISKEYLHSLIKECNKDAIDEVDIMDEAALEQKSVEMHEATNSVGYVIDSLEHLIRVTLKSRLPPWKTTVESARQALLHRREWTQASLSATKSLLVDLGMISIMRVGTMEVACAVIKILKEVGLHEEYEVDSARNRYIFEHFADGDSESSKALLSEYQLMIDNINA
ncbi:codanin-1-like [Varroa destructor]|uniref:Codanin-1 C-terminal domain-containing protein n=1 Tax=Varroa destructor TaxID=109461 RepID=A0A7M7MHW8_VARDE|nr:codanin-1-like [Varroa destructor]